MKYLIKNTLRPIANLFRKIVFKLMRDVLQEQERMKNEIERAVRNSNAKQRAVIKYKNGEMIRIMFLFQAASFWPSWESFYEACISDGRIQVEFTFLDELYGDTTQMLTAKKFLDEKKIPYKIYSDLFFAEFRPHILVMQTPYDCGHRTPHVRSEAFIKRGTRIVYIPYGIEISDTENARGAHFNSTVVENSWRVFTFSERMKMDYHIYSSNWQAVKCLGHPKFDALYHKEKFSQLYEVEKLAKARKILAWHVHFPKITPQPDGSGIMVTPELDIYVKFAKYITKKKDIFVVLLPHPKFLDGEGELGIKAKKIIEILSTSENAYVDWSDDYRNTMLNCNYFITDRSALMVEAAALEVPILYMTNHNHCEPLTGAVMPIVDSYYQGNSFEEMKEFTERCLQGKDPKKEMRREAFKKNIPLFDGKCGERIKEHLLEAIAAEIGEGAADRNCYTGL